MPKVSEIQIKYYPVIKPGNCPKITVTFQAFQLFLEHWDEGLLCYIEQVKVMFLNRNNRVLGIYTASTGGQEGVIIDFRTIFSTGLMCSATSLILAHNHPSGDVETSQADIITTRQMVKAGKLIGIEVKDHLIITPDSYFSFRDRRLIRS